MKHLDRLGGAAGCFHYLLGLCDEQAEGRPAEEIGAQCGQLHADFCSGGGPRWVGRSRGQVRPPRLEPQAPFRPRLPTYRIPAALPVPLPFPFVVLLNPCGSLL